MIKYCPDCQQDLEYDKFGKNRRKKDGLQSVCKKCDNDYKKKLYEQNKEKYKARTKANRISKREWFQEFKKTLECSKCSDSRWYVLDFHHEDGEEKESNIATLVANNCSEGKILKEVAKCSILCSNCHRELHYKRGDRGKKLIW